MNPVPLRVLLVEDNPADALLLREALAEARGVPFSLAHVERLAVAADTLTRQTFDLVLLDLGLPDSVGLATFRELHARAPHIAIIVLSGLDDEEAAIETVHAGAQDYLVKGSVTTELLVRAMRYAVERKRISEELRQRNDQLERDLHMAREFQLALLPGRYPPFPREATPEGSALRFGHCYQPSGAVGGDYFNIFRVGDHRAGVFLGDVMGHGVRAALVTAMIRGLVEELKPEAADPGAYLSGLNRRLAEVLRHAETTMFASAFYLTLDIRTGQLDYARAGHPPPLVIQPAAAQVEPLPLGDQAGSPVLGLFEHSVYPTASMQLTPGDSILLYTDGLYEEENGDSEQFGPDRLLAAVRQRLCLPAHALFSALLQDIRTFAGHDQFADDVCLVSVELARLCGEK